MNKVVHSNKSDHWETPRDLYDGFMKANYFDPCPFQHDMSWDGLEIDWKGKIFCNPPYSNIRIWLEKGLQEFNKGNAKEIIFFIPARTSNKWFHELLYKKPNIKIDFINGRIRFVGGKDPAPFPSMWVTIKKFT